jgi:hypothetical protein
VSLHEENAREGIRRRRRVRGRLDSKRGLLVVVTATRGGDGDEAGDGVLKPWQRADTIGVTCVGTHCATNFVVRSLGPASEVADEPEHTR